MSENFKICILGADLNTGNMGVSALAASLVSLIIDIKPDSDIYLIIGNRSSENQKLIYNGEIKYLKVVNYRLSPKAFFKNNLFWILFLAFFQNLVPLKRIRNFIINSNRCLRVLSAADLIGDIRGGDSFSDIYGLKRFLIGSIPSMIVLLLKKHLILFPQTYGPYKNLITKKVANFILKKAFKLYSRDRLGLDVVRKLINGHDPDDEITLCPDVAFTLKPTIPKNIDIRPFLDKDNINELIGININGLMFNGGYSGKNMFGLKLDYLYFIHQLIIRFLNHPKLHIVLIPHTFGPKGSINNDADACHNILNQVGTNSRLHLLASEYDQNDIKGIIGFTDFFIGSRMHACIAALSQGIPTIGVAYSRKFKGVFDSIGFAENVIDARETDSESAITRIFDFYQNREKQIIEIKNKVSNAKNEIRSVFYKMLN